MLRRFVFAFLAFVGLIVPGTFLLALLAAPAYPAPLERPGCERNLASAGADVAAMQVRVQSRQNGPEFCAATRLYFLELVKARAVTAVCKDGAERERALGRLVPMSSRPTRRSRRAAVSQVTDAIRH